MTMTRNRAAMFAFAAAGLWLASSRPTDAAESVLAPASSAALAATTSQASPLATQGPKPLPVRPPSETELHASIMRGVKFLLGSQRKNGAWGGPQKTKALNIYAPVPGAHHAFRTGVTGLVIEALWTVRPQCDAETQRSIDAALDRGQTWLLANADNLRRAEGEALYNVWGHAYAIHALVALHQRAAGNVELQGQLKDHLRVQVDRLARYTFIDGGWSYYDFKAQTQRPSDSPFSFTTATCLIALKKAESLGINYPADLAKKGVDSLLRQREPDFSYAYGEYLRFHPRLSINLPAGSLGRSQACNLALRMYGDKLVTDEVLKTWLDRLLARNGWLSNGRKRPIPHEGQFGVAGYFYYYGHYYAALCIDELPQQERPHFQDHLARVLLPLQEKDGSWWDYPLYDYHQGWGTAMAVSALVRCQHAAQ